MISKTPHDFWSWSGRSEAKTQSLSKLNHKKSLIALHCLACTAGRRLSEGEHGAQEEKQPLFKFSSDENGMLIAPRRSNARRRNDLEIRPKMFESLNSVISMSVPRNSATLVSTISNQAQIIPFVLPFFSFLSFL